MKRLVWLFVFLLFCGCSSGNHPTEEKPTLTFFTFGDWGSGFQNQLDVAEALKDFCQKNRCDFGVLLGDNFYDFGVTSTEDPLWKEYFEDVYAELNLIFYVVLGNHDHYGNIQAQIDYTGLQNRWFLPALQYQQKFPAEADPPLLEIFFLDSQTFDAADAINLEVLLKNSKAQWKIIAMHHPIYSNGLVHGDTESLKTILRPILCQQVDIVLSGHEHLFSHLFDPTDGCKFHQIISGAGGKSLYNFNESDPRKLFSIKEFGFVTLIVNPAEILIRFHTTDQNVAYSFTLKKL